MKLVIIIPLVIAVCLVVVAVLLRNKSRKELIKPFQIIGLVLGILSMIAVFVSFLISGDKTQLFKLSLPGLIVILAILQLRRANDNNTKKG